MIHAHRRHIIGLGLIGVILNAAASSAAVHVSVEPGRVRIGAQEFVPRFTDLPRVLVVKAGEEVTLPADSTWDAIEVAGTLKVSRTHDTTVRFTHLMILPGGVLDAGTEADPVLRRVEFIVRDVPIDTAKDPYQWGNGLVNFGRQTRVGRALVRTWTELAEDAPAGATTLQLVVPEGWQVGDELLLPDSRQPGSGRSQTQAIRRERTVRIAAISGNMVTLSKPLDFEHLAITDPDGAVVLRPRVANLSRNIVLRSENPGGTPGHTANVGHQASWDIRYNQFVGLGRTRNENVNNAREESRRTYTGTNQIGRYADHDHHGQGFGSRSIGNSYQGHPRGKWARVVHGTHDSLVEENVCTDFPGGCFVTEDGYEVRNVFRRNVAAYATGNGIGATGNIDERRRNDCAGCEGAGFWFRGLINVIEGNEAWNNVTGITLFNRSHKAAPFPSVPGGSADSPLAPRTAVPVSFRGNVTVGNNVTGLEYWSVPRFPAEDHVSAHNRQRQVWLATSNSNYGFFRNVALIGAEGRSECLATSQAYAQGLEVDGGSMKGCEEGVTRGGAIQYLRLRGLVLQNRTNVTFGGFPNESVLENLRHLPLGENPKRYIAFGDGFIWQAPDGPFPGGRLKFSNYVSQRGSRHLVKNWQGTGENYLLFELQQKRSTDAWVANWLQRELPCCGVEFFTPEAGLTMGQAWDKYGLAYRGDVVADEEAVELDGLVNGVARPGQDVRLGPPRAVMTFPNMLNPAIVERDSDGTPHVQLHVILTGNPTSATDQALIAIDGKNTFTHSSRGAIGSTPSTAVSPGIHTVTTWRVDSKGRKVDGSELTFRYFIESSPTQE